MRVICLASLCVGLVFALFSCRTTQAISDEERAIEAFQDGRTGEAVALYESLSKRNPTDLALARNLAEAHVRNGSDDRYLNELQKSPSAIHWYLEGLIRFSRPTEAGVQAIAAFQRAVELEPNQAEYQHRLGVALLESEKFEEARPIIEKALQIDPSKAAWRLPLAKALSRTKDHVGAIKQVSMAIESGQLNERDIKLATALVDSMTDPFATLPQSARPKVEKAIAWLEQSDVPGEAVIALEEVLLDYPNEAAPHSILGLAYARLEDAGRSVEELKRAIELAPLDGKNHQYLGDLYAGRQREKQAEEQFAKAVELNPVLQNSWMRLGDFSLARNDLIEARKRFLVASQLSPKDLGSRGKLALVYQLEKNWSEAAKHLEMAITPEDQNVEFMLRLGILHTEHFLQSTTKIERDAASLEAQKWLEKVLNEQPENALASRALERVKQRK
jgi:Flp pilus assembly protein TadD